jgi:hypothetical protein
VSPSKLHRYNVSATGLTTIDDVNVSGFAGHFTPSNGLLYSDSGGVVDPSPAAPNPPQLVGRFGAAGPSTVDAATKRTFILNGGSFLFLGNSPIHGIVAFDQATFDAVDNVDLSALLPNNFNNGFDLVRWGADGLAFRLAGDIFSSAPGVGKLVLLRGPAVTPQVAVTNAKPTATSVTPSSVAAGTGNTFFTVTGTGFVPGAVASWKGLERSTTFVNSTTLKVAIPVSDLTAAGSAAITVTNPNSVSSAAVTVTIN